MVWDETSVAADQPSPSTTGSKTPRP